jgi:SAM-dependent methyltransferase
MKENGQNRMIRNRNIDHGKGFDWGKASKDYARYRDIYPEEFYEKIIACGICTEGQRVLDLGTGTGVLPRNLYRWGAKFIGADISVNQIAEARRLSQESNMDIEYIVSSAEDVDFPDDSFDAVTASQCYMYFNMDVVLPKLYRILQKNGHFCILYTAWLPDESEIAAKSEELILKYNPDWTGGQMIRSPIVMPELTFKYFSVEHESTYDVGIQFTRESWNGRIRACRGIGASSLSDKEIKSFEEEHIQYLDTVNEVFSVPHYVTMLDLKTKKI